MMMIEDHLAEIISQQNAAALAPAVHVGGLGLFRKMHWCKKAAGVISWQFSQFFLSVYICFQGKIWKTKEACPAARALLKPTFLSSSSSVLLCEQF